MGLSSGADSIPKKKVPTYIDNPLGPELMGGRSRARHFNGDIQRTAFIGRLAIPTSLLARRILQEIFGCVGQRGYIEPSLLWITVAISVLLIGNGFYVDF